MASRAPAFVEEQDQVELHVRLTNTEPPAYKEYNLDLVKEGNGWIVSYANGRIGGTLAGGRKTTAPVPYWTARQIYDRVLKEKKGGHYVPDENSPASAPLTTSNGKEKIDTGLRPQLLERIGPADAEQFILNPHWCMQQKFDGVRLFVVGRTDEHGNWTVYGAHRKGNRVDLPVAIAAYVAELLDDESPTSDNRSKDVGDEPIKSVPASFVFDGELVGSDYNVFDLLELNGQDLRANPYKARLLTLRATLAPKPRPFFEIAYTAQTVATKRALYTLLIQQDQEGCVLKSMDAPYTPGRIPTQLKCKFWESATFIVISDNGETDGKASVGIGLLDPQNGYPHIQLLKSVKEWGNCTMPQDPSKRARIGDLIEVKYLYCDDHVYQPVFKGVRTDVSIDECTLEQQKLKFKPGSRNATA